jgi:hypothetical protein
MERYSPEFFGGEAASALGGFADGTAPSQPTICFDFTRYAEQGGAAVHCRYGVGVDSDRNSRLPRRPQLRVAAQRLGGATGQVPSSALRPAGAQATARVTPDAAFPFSPAAKAGQQHLRSLGNAYRRGLLVALMRLGSGDACRRCCAS